RRLGGGEKVVFEEIAHHARPLSIQSIEFLEALVATHVEIARLLLPEWDVWIRVLEPANLRVVACADLCRDERTNQAGGKTGGTQPGNHGCRIIVLQRRPRGR